MEVLPGREAAAAGFLAPAVSWIDRIVAYSAAILSMGALVILFMALMAEVVVRYFTTKGLGWPAEMPNLLFPWLVMGGIVLAAQRGQHIAVSAGLLMLRRSHARLLLLAMQVLIAVTFIYLGQAGIAVIEITGSEKYPISGITARWAYLAVVAGFFGIALTAITTGVRVLLADDPLSVQSIAPEEEI